MILTGPRKENPPGPLFQGGVVYWFTSLLLIVTVVLPAEEALGAGPSPNPEQWPDYGGTPDIAVPKGMGLNRSEVERVLDKLGSTQFAGRAAAFEELLANARGSEQAFRQVLWARHRARNAEMKQAIREAHKRTESSTGAGDLLKGLLTIPPDDAKVGLGATASLRIMAMLHALADLDTMAAYKVLIDFSLRHAGVFRREIGRLLVAQKLSALPALIYGRGSKNKEIHMFSVKWIRDMGNPLLSEQVTIKNSRRLAQLLEAYASVNELDAIEVTLSLTNHESVFVRRAARASLRAYGKNIKWPVRRLYENTLGEEPPRRADYRSLLDKLYRHFDAQRLARAKTAFNKGLAAYREGRLDEMATIFRLVLRDEPMFPKRDQMAVGFLDHARLKREQDDEKSAQASLLMAYRVAQPGSEQARRAEAELTFAEAESLRQRGIAVPQLYRQIATDHPEHDAARQWFERLTEPVDSTAKLGRKAILVAVFIFLGALLVYRRLP